MKPGAPAALLAALAVSLVPAHAAPTPQDMSGMAMPAPAAPKTTDPNAGPQAPSGTDQAPGDGTAPPISSDRAADRYYDPQAMADAQTALLDAHGGMKFSKFMLNLAELQVRKGSDGYRWDGAFWIGGDLNRFVVKSEGEGRFNDRIESADVQALYSRALDPYWNLQLGVRREFGTGSHRSYFVLGVEGLAPYGFDTEGALFLSDKGQLLARATASYDERITNRLVLQPRAEANLSFQDMPRERIGSGLSNLELGLRLRYEIKREFAPYVGISWDRKLGKTADFARVAGDDTGGASFVAGLRLWF